MGGIFSVLYFATYQGPQVNVSLHSSFVLTGFVRRDVWLKIDLNSALLLGLGSKRTGSHGSISAKASMTSSHTINEDLSNILVFYLPYEEK